jgi:hypothetical protein
MGNDWDRVQRGWTGSGYPPGEPAWGDLPPAQKARRRRKKKRKTQAAVVQLPPSKFSLPDVLLPFDKLPERVGRWEGADGESKCVVCRMTLPLSRSTPLVIYRSSSPSPAHLRCSKT